MILYNLIWYTDNRSLCLKIGPIPNKLLYFVIISFMFWLQISSIVLMFGMIVGMPGFWTQTEESAGDITCNIAGLPGPRCCMTCHHDALNHFKRLTDLGWSSRNPTDGTCCCQQNATAGVKGSTWRTDAQSFKKWLLLLVEGAFDGIWTFFLQVDSAM